MYVDVCLHVLILVFASVFVRPFSVCASVHRHQPWNPVPVIDWTVETLPSQHADLSDRRSQELLPEGSSQEHVPQRSDQSGTNNRSACQRACEMDQWLARESQKHVMYNECGCLFTLLSFRFLLVLKYTVHSAMYYLKAPFLLPEHVLLKCSISIFMAVYHQDQDRLIRIKKNDRLWNKTEFIVYREVVFGA